MAGVEFPKKKGVVEFPKKGGSIGIKPPEPAPLKEAGWGESIVDLVKSLPGATADVAVEVGTLPITAARGVLGAKLLGQDVYNRATEGEWLTDEEVAAIRQEDREAPGGSFLQGAFEFQDAARQGSRASLYQPKTEFGAGGKELATFLLPAAAPSKVTTAATGGTKAANWVADVVAHGGFPYLGYKGAQAATEGTPYEDYAALLGAGLGGVGGGAGRSYIAPQSIVKRMVRDTPPEAVNRATEIQRNPFDIEIPAASAFAEATNNPNHPFLKALRMGEASDVGARITGPLFERQTGQVINAITGEIEPIAPQHPNPPTLGAQAGEVATNTIRAAEGRRSAAEQPHYRAADPTLVDRTAMDNFIARVDAERARYNPESAIGQVLDNFRNRLVNAPATPGTPGTPATRTPVYDPKTGKLLRYDQTTATPGTPGTPEQFAYDRLNLDTVKKEFREATRQGQVGQVAIPSNVKGVLGPFLDDLDTILETGSPEYQAGKAAHAAATRGEVLPLQEGTVGKVAAAGTTEGAGSAIMEPTVGGVPRRMQDIQDMMANDPEGIIPAIVRQETSRRFDKAREVTQTMSEEGIAPKFYKSVAGTPAKREMFEAITRTVNPATRFPQLLDTLRAASRRLGQGSVTQPLTTMGRELSENLGARAMEVGLSTAPWATAMRIGGKLVEDAILRMNVGTLTDLATGTVGNAWATTQRGVPLMADAVARANLGSLANLFAQPQR